MGWFDNEQDQHKSNAMVPQPEPRPRTATAAPPESESTMGRQIQVDGTIVCEEDLTILGRVHGKIHAQGTLVIAKEADVHATIDGQRVLVHGNVDGDVHGSERVVLGQTARLKGNIEATTLEINEGAYFNGNVEMHLPKSGISSGKASSGQDEPDNSPTDDVETSGLKSVGDSSTDETSAAQEQATS
ncbi:MAG TPA: polymer-forming cytoskeletal protein [Acidobacteriota bacterium]|jgi:cytoskeletal protein CcmA (bactofilin family)|nr:hypothetical protein [Acidobacteriota bacterium]HJO29234.1 polymer-forming cytoskeletal protein [Acidobacteriota bacterium]|tara:strand:- start:5552 stop:6112 length:561 start_codon:yes stop_codon:yes gene_type:complete